MIRSYKGIMPTIPDSCYVDESAQVIGDVVLGENASIWMNAVLRGDVHSIRIGAHSNVQDCSVLHGMKQQYGVFVGEYVTVGHSVTLHGCTIEDRCLIGMGSIILNGAKIGAGSIIAAGTLIPEKAVVEPGSLWMGSPGKFRRKLEGKDQETILRYAKNYLEYKDSYFGMGSIILNGAKIGAGSIIAAGTLIPEKTVVEPQSLWMGSPGKFRRKVEEKDQETILRYAKNYLEYKDSYLKAMKKRGRKQNLSS